MCNQDKISPKNVVTISSRRVENNEKYKLGDY